MNNDKLLYYAVKAENLLLVKTLLDIQNVGSDSSSLSDFSSSDSSSSDSSSSDSSSSDSSSSDSSSQNINECPVCFETYENKCRATISCGHVCCYSCLSKLKRQYMSCPICRKSLQHEHIIKLYL
jgi:hypothetical protein